MHSFHTRVDTAQRALPLGKTSSRGQHSKASYRSGSYGVEDPDEVKVFFRGPIIASVEEPFKLDKDVFQGYEDPFAPGRGTRKRRDSLTAKYCASKGLALIATPSGVLPEAFSRISNQI